jgi:hypothetical protein
MDSKTLAERIRPFLDAGLVPEAPTRWQVLQGELQMWPWVLGDDVTEESRYRPFWGHPVVRQPLLAARIGVDHVAVGVGLAVDRDAIIRHLQLTYHHGLPVWDLQVLVTHTDGLAALRASTESLLRRDTRDARITGRLADRLLVDPDAYHRRFLGADGWIARAEAGEWPSAAEEGSGMPDPFFRLTSFLTWCLQFPETPGELGLRLPLHLVDLATRGLRQVDGFAGRELA